ncbi:Flp family type IVb pilin [Methylobacterium sp. SD274]|uniref:Flp family type IVb pilin n=1 Tax=Methylobacterium sp. SD274 TaxID=2782009 RepID=UPI001A967F01|nr:Flp family type IVb pilin [Methylobacterium sp. SD274]MBO1022542.1 Flp family type IVb pilin [Methylobacterium sp. SD274]
MSSIFKRFAADESGATAIEYGLIASLIAVAIITGLTTLSGSITGAFDKVGLSLAK